MRHIIFILGFIGVYQASAQFVPQNTNMCLQFYVTSTFKLNLMEPVVIRHFDPNKYNEVANDPYFISLKERAEKIATGELNYSKSENWVITHSYLMTEQMELFRQLANHDFYGLDQNAIWRFHASYSNIVESLPYIAKQQRSISTQSYKTFLRILDEYQATVAETNIFSKMIERGFTLVPSAKETIKDTLKAEDRNTIDRLQLYVMTIKLDNSLLASSGIFEKGLMIVLQGFKKNRIVPEFLTELNTFVEHLLEEYKLGRTNITKVSELLEATATLVDSSNFKRVYPVKKSNTEIHDKIAKFNRLKTEFENRVNYTKKSFLAVVRDGKQVELGQMTDVSIADYNKAFELAMRSPQFLYQTGAILKKIEQQLSANATFANAEIEIPKLNQLLARFDLLLDHFPKNKFKGYFSMYNKQEINQVIESRRTLESIRKLIEPKE